MRSRCRARLGFVTAGWIQPGGRGGFFLYERERYIYIYIYVSLLFFVRSDGGGEWGLGFMKGDLESGDESGMACCNGGCRSRRQLVSSDGGC